MNQSPFILRFSNGAAKVFGGQAVFEGVRAVDEEDGNLRAVALLKFGVGEDVDLFKGELTCAAGACNLALGFVAEVAARLRVEGDVRSVGHFFSVLRGRARGKRGRGF